MSVFLKIALLADLIALWLEKATSAWTNMLPLTGDHFGQLAMFVIFALIAEEIAGLFR
ncbi:hypothetical protein [Rhizobium leguminosarum]|uniref:hypothetical protein n=1 Tax=Rhizobium leguminosarum TaxID=384 RepID=UPI001C8FED85|nr:hypothetical protein [Rhizobium leguminosarum]MBY2985660.1 hypothetical protein [Rhizobium leguminosarum]